MELIVLCSLWLATHDLWSQKIKEPRFPLNTANGFTEINKKQYNMLTLEWRYYDRLWIQCGFYIEFNMSFESVFMYSDRIPKTESFFHLPENIGIVNSGRNLAICLDKNMWDWQYASLNTASKVVSTLSSTEIYRKTKH